MDDRVRGEVHILGEPSPEARCHVDTGMAIAQCSGCVSAPRGAKTEIASEAVCAMPARKILLNHYAVALGKAPALGGYRSDPHDRPRVLVSHDAIRVSASICTWIAPAHAGGLDLHQRPVDGHLRHPKLTQLGTFRCDLHCSYDRVGHSG